MQIVLDTNFLQKFTRTDQRILKINLHVTSSDLKTTDREFEIVSRSRDMQIVLDTNFLQKFTRTDQRVLKVNLHATSNDLKTTDWEFEIVSRSFRTYKLFSIQNFPSSRAAGKIPLELTPCWR